MSRRIVSWLAVVLGLWIAGGVTGAVVGLVLAVWHAARPPVPRTLLMVAVLLLAAVPIAWLLGNLSRLGDVSFALVVRNIWPHRLAFAALAFLTIGIIRDVAESRGTFDDGVG